MNEQLWYNIIAKIKWKTDKAILLSFDRMYNFKEVWIPIKHYKELDGKLFINQKAKRYHAIKINPSNASNDWHKNIGPIKQN